MDDTQGSRIPDAAATRKRRSSILKNQRPPRTPFSELEFNVATPTDTAKSRRVSFSRRTDVAEFVTNEATTTWKTMYVEQNRSFESSMNESAMHQSRPTVCTLGKRAIFEQQFQEEAVDLGTLTPNPRVHEMNMSIMNINFSQQIADLEREDMKFSAPQKLELSSFTEDRSKLFAELTAPVTGASNKIEVDFSAIQPLGDKCDDLDEIQRDLLGSNSVQAMRRPFDSPDASEYIEVDLNTTHIGVKRDASDMSITDSIHSPVKGIPQDMSLKRDSSNLKNDWLADKENIAINPYVAPKESANFAINEMPDQVLVFDGRKLTVQRERQTIDRNGGEVESQPTPSTDPLAKKKTIVLNVNDDLPNFADDATLLGHGLSTSKVGQRTNELCQTNQVPIPSVLGPNSHNTVIYDDSANISVTRAMPTNILEQEKRKTILFENDGELSITQALPSNFAQTSVVPRNGTVVYGGEEISFTQALPVKVLSQTKVASQNRTVLYGGEDISFTQAVPVKVLADEMATKKSDFDISLTQALPNNVILSNKPDKRNTTVYGNDTGDISMTRVLPSNIISNDQKGDVESLVPGNSKSMQQKSIMYDKGSDISMTEAVPKNIILANVLKSSETTINHDNDVSETKMIPSNIVEYDKLSEKSETEQKGCGSLKLSDNFATNMSITEAIPEYVVLSHLISKRKTIDTFNMSVTKVLPTNIITNEKSSVEEGLNDFSITQAVPDTIVILNEIHKTNTDKIDSNSEKIDLSQEVTMTDNAANNVTSNEKMQLIESIKCELLSKAIAETEPSIAQDKFQNKDSELCNQGINNVSIENIKPINIQPNDLLNNQKIDEVSDVPISSHTNEFDRKQLDTSTNAKSIYSKSISQSDEHEVILDKDELFKKSHANVLETSKRGDVNTKFDTADTEKVELLETSCKKSDEILDISKIENDSVIIKHSEKNAHKSVTEMSRDVLVYQAVTNHNVSKQLKNLDNIYAHISQADMSLIDIVPKSITLTNAIRSADTDDNISKNKTILTDMVRLDGILEICGEDKRKGGEEFDKFASEIWTREVAPENFLISPKRKTLDLTGVEVKHQDVIMECPVRNDITFAKEYEEEYFRRHTINASTQNIRKSNLIDETSDNMRMEFVNKRQTIHDIVMESPQRNNIDIEKEHKEPRTSVINNESIMQQKLRKSILNGETQGNIYISQLDPSDNVQTDIVMKSPQQNNITLGKQHEEQYSRMSTVNSASTAQRKPKKSILSELLKMSDDSIDISEDNMDDQCEISEKEMQDVLIDTESNETHKNYEELQESGNKSNILAHLSQSQGDMYEQNNSKLHSPQRETNYSNVASANCESTQMNDEHKQSREKTIEDVDNEEIEKEEMAIDESKSSVNHCKEADNTKELLEMLSDFTDKTIIKQSKEEPAEKVLEQVGSNENSYSNEPRRLSLAKSRMSTVLSREDLLMNISMAYAALQQARTDTEESENEDTLDDTEDQIERDEPEETEAVDEIGEAIEELDCRRRSVRASTEVVKTLQFDDTTTDVIPKSDDNLSPLRKSVYGDISQRVDSRARVIPSFEVSDQVKLLMQDLVKPLADDTVFGKTSPEKSTKATNSTRSINLQANIITSSQIDIDMDSDSGVVNVDVQTEPEYSQNVVMQSPEPVKEPMLRKSDQVRRTPMLTFDPTNPLNNVFLPNGNTEIHKYSPNRSAVTAEEIQGSPIKPILEKNAEEYNIQRVSTHYKINTSAVVLNSSIGMDYRDRRAHSIDNDLDPHIKDSEVNTLIAMKCNKELLEETSCLTLVDDDDQDPIEIEDSQQDLVEPEGSPLRVIYKTDACDNYTSSVDLDSEDGKPKKRIYSPARPDPTKKATTSSLEVTPKPLSKIQKLSTSPNATRQSIKHEIESLDKSDEEIGDAKAVSSKGKYGGTVIVQQMAECKVDSGMDVASSTTSSSELSSCTLKAAGSVCGTAASKDSCTFTDPLPLSVGIDPIQRELDILAERENSANVLEKIDSLSFMGSQDCRWDCSDADTWRFRLLRGRLLLSVRLGHVTGDWSRDQTDGVTCGSGNVRADTPVLSTKIELVREEADPLARTCVRLAGEAMRYECVRGGVLHASSVPRLLRRCLGVARVARTWLRAMDDARINLAFDTSPDGTLRLNVANIRLRTIYEMSFRIELAVGDAREAAWPRADGVRVRDVTAGYARHASHAGDVTPGDALDVGKLLSRVPQDWGHVPRTIWKIFRHLKNKTKDDDWFGDLALHRPQHRTN